MSIALRVFTLNIKDAPVVKWDIESFLRTTGDTWEIKHVQRVKPGIEPMLRIRVDGFVGTREDWRDYIDNLSTWVNLKNVRIQWVRGKKDIRFLSRANALRSVTS